MARLGGRPPCENRSKSPGFVEALKPRESGSVRAPRKYLGEFRERALLPVEGAMAEDLQLLLCHNDRVRGGGQPSSARFARGCGIALGIVAALVLIPVGCVSYALFHTERWTGDVPAVVSDVDLPGGYSYEVEFTGMFPPEALTGPREHQGGAVYEYRAVTLDPVSELGVDPVEPGEVQIGDRLTCRVEQTYTMNTDLKGGPETSIEYCWR
jgi:hypothetical protein